LVFLPPTSVRELKIVVVVKQAEELDQSKLFERRYIPGPDHNGSFLCETMKRNSE
jgi:hypothetical protein